MAKFYSTKTYGNDRGLSCVFRQWRASHSHCSTLHGYSIGIKLIFESDTLDLKNWVFDFGGLKAFKDWADYMFDHTLIVASDDPNLEDFIRLSQIKGKNANLDSFYAHERGALCDLRVVDGVGCEMFAKLCYDTMNTILKTFLKDSAWRFTDSSGILRVYESRYPVGPDVKLKSVEVFEHAGNSATYEGV
jgi:6-pyruvoyltetrahydropterin/6-carboxytetrahydropterin synthase